MSETVGRGVRQGLNYVKVTGIDGQLVAAVDVTTTETTTIAMNCGYRYTAVPEPGGLTLTGLGLAGLVGFALRRSAAGPGGRPPVPPSDQTL